MSQDFDEELVSRLEKPLVEATLDTLSQTLSLPGKKISVINVVHKGPYGSLVLVKDATNGKEYLWKFSKNSQCSLKNEAYLQSIAHHALVKHGFPWAVPAVEDVFYCKNYGTGFLMNHIKDANIFANYLQTHFNWSVQCKENDTLLIEIIVQLASYLIVLDKKLSMNHRDLKSTNVILVETENVPFQFVTCSDTKIYKLITKHKAILVDFGFACANMNEKIIAAGDYLPTFDGCPKVGRDMFLFLSNIWNVEMLRSKLTVQFQDWIKNRLQTDKKSWASFLESVCDPAMKFIYLFTTSEKFKAPECSPLRILETLANEFPSTLKVNHV